MHGPAILARSTTQPSVTDRYGNVWQYHSRSDQHSRVACWGLLFDLIRHCPLLAHHIKAGKVNFGINHQMSDFRTGRKKNLDLVICTPALPKSGPESFTSLADKYSILLTSEERRMLHTFPPLTRAPVGSVHLALEAKACMTEHGKARPRLYDELNSSHQAIHGSADFAIAAGFAVVNLAPHFISPLRNKSNLIGKDPEVTTHDQPKATQRVIEKLKEIPRRTQAGKEGFDALGIVVLNIRNDGSRVTVVGDPPAPANSDPWHYDQMIHRVGSLYASKFGNV